METWPSGIRSRLIRLPSSVRMGSSTLPHTVTSEMQRHVSARSIESSTTLLPLLGPPPWKQSGRCSNNREPALLPRLNITVSLLWTSPSLARRNLNRLSSLAFNWIRQHLKRAENQQIAGVSLQTAAPSGRAIITPTDEPRLNLVEIVPVTVFVQRTIYRWFFGQSDGAKSSNKQEDDWK